MDDYYTEVLGRSHHADDYIQAMDRAFVIAARKRCGVRVVAYSDGDIVITATPNVSYGDVQHREQQ